jgi:hypothetical protein
MDFAFGLADGCCEEELIEGGDEGAAAFEIVPSFLRNGG